MPDMPDIRASITVAVLSLEELFSFKFLHIEVKLGPRRHFMSGMSGERARGAKLKPLDKAAESSAIVVLKASKGPLALQRTSRGKGARGVRQIFVFLQELFIVKENQAEGAFIAKPPLSRNLSRPKRFNALTNLD